MGEENVEPLTAVFSSEEENGENEDQSEISSEEENEEDNDESEISSEEQNDENEDVLENSEGESDHSVADQVISIQDNEMMVSSKDEKEENESDHFDPIPDETPQDEVKESGSKNDIQIELKENTEELRSKTETNMSLKRKDYNNLRPVPCRCRVKKIPRGQWDINVPP